MIKAGFSKWKLVPAVVALMVGIYSVLLFSGNCTWVGSKDLAITFAVCDDSGQPIPGASVEIVREEYNFCSNKDTIPFTLHADSNGRARYLGKNCMCYGSRSGWSWTGHIDTFAIHIPGWQYKVSAPGYQDSDFLFLDNSENEREVQRGTDHASLTVQVRLHK